MRKASQSAGDDLPALMRQILSELYGGAYE